jgi:hypothetical protein
MSWLKRNYQFNLFKWPLKWFGRKAELLIWSGSDEFWPDWKEHFVREEAFWFVSFGPVTFAWENTKKLFGDLEQ